jgi:hypothetical protein
MYYGKEKEVEEGFVFSPQVKRVTKACAGHVGMTP